MGELIQTVNALRNVPRSDLGALVRRVVVVLSGPRSGSSLVKSVLARHPDIAAMDGEIEPFLALTGNGFGYNSDSDAIGVVSNGAALVDNILDDLSLPTDTLPPPEDIRRRWEKRLLMQLPCLFSRPQAHDRLLRALDEALARVMARPDGSERELQARLLSAVFRDEPWRMGCYDGHGAADAGVAFNEPVKIEEPPFVVPGIRRRALTADELATKILLFKTPPDAYRIGMYERLFPNAEVEYIHLTRGYAQSVNGLMDGWLSPVGFFSHDVGDAGWTLDIRGYSDRVGFGRRWWKFDLPPNWPSFTAADLESVCLNQWLSAHEAVLKSGVPALRVGFEEFVSQPSATTRRITGYLGLGPIDLPPSLPVVMAIEAPRAQRWRKRGHLLALGERREVRAMMHLLGYTMDPESWL
jgi:hypothetical protein